MALRDLKPRLQIALCSGALAILGGTARAQSCTGHWSLTPGRDSSTVQLRLEQQHGANDSERVTTFKEPASRLEWLSPSHLSNGGDVRFAFRVDAGTFEFAGHLNDRRGAGVYTFTPSMAFRETLVRRGFHAPTPEQQCKLGFADVNLGLVDALHEQGYARPSIGDLIEMGYHGVTERYVRQLGNAGYRLGHAADLVQLRDHGVTPTFVENLTHAGLPRRTPRELVDLVDHGVSVEYMTGLARAGYDHLSTSELIDAHDHGLRVQFAAGVRRAGYPKATLDDLVALVDHGVTLGFIKEANSGGAHLSLDEIIRMKDRGSP